METHDKEYLKELEMGCRHKDECEYKDECIPPAFLDSCGIYSSWTKSL